MTPGPKFSRRRLGQGGPAVARLGLGTVALGMAYGIGAKGHTAAPDHARGIGVLRRAATAGIDLFDTAPAYGSAEAVLGLAFAGQPGPVIATKVTIDPSWSDETIVERVTASINTSRRALERDSLDVVKIHNATAALMARPAVVNTLRGLMDEGVIRRLGASVYGEADALAVIATPGFTVLQIAYSVLDQRLAARTFPAAAAAGVGIVVRSALLKGALSERARELPPQLAPLRQAAERVCEIAECDFSHLPDLALRFALSAPEPVTTVLIGAQDESELATALAAYRAGPLDRLLMDELSRVGLDDDALLNPARWPRLEPA